MPKGLLSLFPNVLGEKADPTTILADCIQKAVSQIDALVAESEKAGRRFLKHFSFSKGRTFRDIPIYRYCEHATKEDLEEILDLLRSGKRLGLVSDAGLPCIADPGSQIVLSCHKENIPLQAFPGPNSILLSLMLSGFSGQSFTFHGYFPKQDNALRKQIQQMNTVHIFIETPYRNESRLKMLLELLPSKAWLSVAWDLTLPSEQVITRQVFEWKKKPLPDIRKKPAIFSFKPDK